MIQDRSWARRVKPKSSDDTMTGCVMGLKIRRYNQEDAAQVRWLYHHAVLENGEVASDKPADVYNVGQHYQYDEQVNFWIAECGGEAIGTLGVLRVDRQVVELRRLRVHPDQPKKEISLALLEKAIHDCRRRGYIKIILDTRFEPEPAMHLFERCAFQHHLDKEIDGHVISEFIVDLYKQPRTSV